MQAARLKRKGRPAVPRASPAFWVLTHLPRGGGKQELRQATASAMASTEQKNSKMQSWGAWAQSQEGKKPKEKAVEEAQVPSASPQPALPCPGGAAAAFQPSHPWAQPHHWPQGGHELPGSHTPMTGSLVGAGSK